MDGTRRPVLSRQVQPSSVRARSRSVHCQQTRVDGREERTERTPSNEGQRWKNRKDKSQKLTPKITPQIASPVLLWPANSLSMLCSLICTPPFLNYAQIRPFWCRFLFPCNQKKAVPDVSVCVALRLSRLFSFLSLLPPPRTPLTPRCAAYQSRFAQLCLVQRESVHR